MCKKLFFFDSDVFGCSTDVFMQHVVCKLGGGVWGASPQPVKNTIQLVCNSLRRF